jgi:hypothetical protein
MQQAARIETWGNNAKRNSNNEIRQQAAHLMSTMTVPEIQKQTKGNLDYLAG